MAQSTSHSHRATSTKQAVYVDLERSFQQNRPVVAAMQAVTDDLKRYPRGAERDRACIMAVFELLLHGPEADQSPDDLRYLAAIGVPRELARGSTRDR